MNSRKPSAAILEAHAHSLDQDAMRALLEPLPLSVAADVREIADPDGRGTAGMQYDIETQKAFWLQHGTEGVVTVVTFLHISSVDMAAKLWDAIAQATSLNADGLHAIYAEVTGHRVRPMGTRN